MRREMIACYPTKEEAKEAAKWYEHRHPEVKQWSDKRVWEVWIDEVSE